VIVPPAALDILVHMVVVVVEAGIVAVLVAVAVEAPTTVVNVDTTLPAI